MRQLGFISLLLGTTTQTNAINLHFLQVGGYQGSSGKNSFSYHSGHYFTTYDKDNDADSNKNCADYFLGRYNNIEFVLLPNFILIARRF